MVTIEISLKIVLTRMRSSCIVVVSWMFLTRCPGETTGPT